MKWLALLALWPTLAFANETYADHASRWAWQWSPGTAKPVQMKHGFGISIPTYNGPLPCKSDQSCASAHYLVTDPIRPLVGAKSITVSGCIWFTGKPVLHWQTEPANHGSEPAAFHIYFQRRGDNWTGKNQTEFFRWWSNPGKVVIKPGPFTLTVPLRYGKWSSVQGYKTTGAALQGFRAAMANPGKIGMTFGGGWFFGHGLNVRGGHVTIGITKFQVVR